MMTIFTTLRPIRPARNILCASLLLLVGCTSYIPRENSYLPLVGHPGDDTIKLVTVPLPVIASSPNEGVTTGALVAFLAHNRQDEVTTLLAPQVTYNNTFGATVSLYGAYYPSADRNIEFNLSRSGRVNHDYELRIRDTSQMDRKLELNGLIFKLTDGSSRFFGFNAKSPQQMETNYANDELGYNISAGYRIGRHYQITIGDRYRDVEIRSGAFTTLPDIKDKFSSATVPGIDGFTTHSLRVSLSYSTLDNRDTPTYGGYARISFEPTMKDIGGEGNYRHYEVEAKGYIPLSNARYISVFRLMYNQTLGKDVPFLEQSILGGENTLRGYGRSRFIDNSFLLCNLEERIRLFRWEVFGVTADWEVAPFIDLGAVMEALNKADGSNFEFNPGIGFRAIVRPNIIGRVDLGVGKDGPAVFVGLGYPF
ncbi:MAG: BamA/TamA family outer membrane protein [Desulfuromonadaceae bacterium]|nr:BamA/TamA family outer membrane protein [Desulfuromonadaceae bacterium]